jgi:tRNA G18 (ribose-2'-O)-methylase SpoU
MMADNAEKSLPELYEEETVADRAALAHQEEHLAAWERLPPELVAEATAVLKPYVQKGRIERMETVFRQRTARTRFLFENPANPSNVWACLRTMDSFGIQHTDLVLQSDQYLGKAALQQKRGMRTAVGSAQWLTLRNHPSTADAVETLRHQAASQGKDLKLYASDLCPTSVDIRTIDWNLPEDHQICIVMGNEERGISNEMRELADVTFSLPMVGFAESFNLSVATAITLAHLSAASAANKGPLRLGDLPEQEINCLMLKGLLHSLPQKRMADALLRKEGIELPKEIVRLL